jgi:hypothetical protein
MKLLFLGFLCLTPRGASAISSYSPEIRQADQPLHPGGRTAMFMCFSVLLLRALFACRAFVRGVNFLSVNLGSSHERHARKAIMASHAMIFFLSVSILYAMPSSTPPRATALLDSMPPTKSSTS